MNNVVDILFKDLFGLLFAATICFLVFAAFSHEGRLPSIDMPKANQIQNIGTGETKSVNISLTSENGNYKYFYEKRPVKKEELINVLRQSGTRSVILRIEKNIPYKEVFSLIFDLKQAGITSIQFGYLRGK